MTYSLPKIEYDGTPTTSLVSQFLIKKEEGTMPEDEDEVVQNVAATVYAGWSDFTSNRNHNSAWICT